MRLLTAFFAAALLAFAPVAHAQNIGGALGTPVGASQGGTGSSSNTSALNWTGSLTWANTNGTSFALPGASDTLAGLGTIQTWSAVQTFSATPVFSAGLNLVNGQAIGINGQAGELLMEAFGSSSGGALFGGNVGGSSSAPIVSYGAFSTLSNSGGVLSGFDFSPTLNQTSTAGTHGFNCDPTTTAQGSGDQDCLTSGTVALGETAHITLAGTGNFKALQVNGALICSSAAPTIANGGGLGAVGTIVGNACAFDVTAGTGAASTFTITLPTASHDWTCTGSDITTASTTVFIVKQNGTGSATTATMGNYNDTGSLAAVGAGDHLRIMCMAF